MTEKIKSLTQYIPAFYPLLIYLGFIRYDFYYQEFDIDIFNYLSVSEILFSFVPLIAPVLIKLTYILFAFLTLSRMISGGTPSNITKFDHLSTNFLKDVSNCIYSLFSTNYSSLERRIKRVEKYIKDDPLKEITRLTIKKMDKRVFRMTMIQLFFTFFFLLIFLKSFEWISDFEIDLSGYLNFIDSVVLGEMLFLLTIIVSFISIAIYYKKNINYAFLFFIVTNSLILILFLLSNEKERADHLYENPLETEVSFFYEDDLIISDCNKVFLGKTADYIFLRNFERKENYIFKIDDVTELRIRDLK